MQETTVRFEAKDIGVLRKAADHLRGLNTETGEIRFEDQPPTWDEMAAAFEEHERTGFALDDAKERVKALKLEHEEANTNLARLGKRLRSTRGIR